MNRVATAAAVTGVGLLAAHALPADDGPHPRSTPFFLRLLADRGVRATFFMLGSELVRAPSLGREIAAAGHEIALHGWYHRRLVWYGPRRTYDELARGRDLIAEVTGTAPRWFRPPYGVLTTSALVTARRLGMSPVLWSCWGWDWSSRSTPDSVYTTVRRALGGGGTVLLHDSDVAADAGRAAAVARRVRPAGVVGRPAGRARGRPARQGDPLRRLTQVPRQPVIWPWHANGAAVAGADRDAVRARRPNR